MVMHCRGREGREGGDCEGESVAGVRAGVWAGRERECVCSCRQQLSREAHWSGARAATHSGQQEGLCSQSPSRALMQTSHLVATGGEGQVGAAGAQRLAIKLPGVEGALRLGCNKRGKEGGRAGGTRVTASRTTHECAPCIASWCPDVQPGCSSCGCRRWVLARQREC